MDAINVSLHPTQTSSDRRREGSLKVDDIDGCFYVLFYSHIISSMQSGPLVPRQTWRLTGDSVIWHGI